jgi:DHA3 family tetracycline resistance protein-like MFS transporter
LNDRRAQRIFLALGAGHGFANGLQFTAMMVYYITVVQLTPFQLVLVGTALEGSILVFQVPTGIFADAISRKLSIFIGTLLSGAGALIIVAQPSFLPILAGQIVWGLGYSFSGGAVEAWIAGEVGDGDLPRLFLRRTQVGQLGFVVGLPLTMLLGSLDIRLPIVVAGLWVLGLAALVAFGMRETKAPGPAASRRANIVATATGSWRLIRAQPALIVLLLVALFYGMASEGFDRLSDAHLLRDLGLAAMKPFSPVVWIGLLDLGIVVLSLPAAEVVRRWRVASHSPDAVLRTVLALNSAQVVAMAVFALAPNLIVSVAALYAVALARRIAHPLYNAWVTQRADPAVRATILSVAGQADAVGQVVGGPPIGLIGSLVSIPAALLVSAACLLPALPLIRSVRRWARPGPESAQAGVVAATPEP